MKWHGRIVGTIEDDFDGIEADTEQEARDAALDAWRYVEFVDLEIESIEPDESC